MNKNKTIHTLQEALRIFWLENAQSAGTKLSERDLELILSADDATFDMSEAKKKQLINRLYDTVSGPSLGVLVTTELKTKGISNKKFAEQIDIPVAVLDELKQDKLYPNSIPVLAMKDLLNTLGIAFRQAKQAMLKTYELIKMNVNITGKACEGQVSYRKGNEEEDTGMRVKNRSDGGGLFENRESLEKYLAMLEEEMSE
jgi:hypothetical protein